MNVMRRLLLESLNAGFPFEGRKKGTPFFSAEDKTLASDGSEMKYILK